MYLLGESILYDRIVLVEFATLNKMSWAWDVNICKPAVLLKHDYICYC